MDSKVDYLKDQLAQLNCDWSVFNSKSASASALLDNHFYNNLNIALINDAKTDATIKNETINKHDNISSNIMIYLALKETINKLNFDAGFKQAIRSHYQEDANNYTEQIKQFNYFREVNKIFNSKN